MRQGKNSKQYKATVTDPCGKTATASTMISFCGETITVGTTSNAGATAKTGDSVTLTMTMTSGNADATSGVTVLWQSSPDGISWTDIDTATTTGAYTTGNITSTKNVTL
jgi:hypothetical protein